MAACLEALLQETTCLERDLETIATATLLRSQSQISGELLALDGLQVPKGEPALEMGRLAAQIEMYLNRTKDQCVTSVFNTHADKGKKMILPNKLSEALGEFGVHLPADEVAALVTVMDIDNNGGLDLAEFTAALRQPTTPVEQYVQTLPISGMLASCLATPRAAEPLKELSNLTSEQLKDAIDAFSVSLHQELKKQLEVLKSLVEAKGANAQEDSDGSGSKSAVFVMNAGSVKEFYEGMYERIGKHNLTNSHLDHIYDGFKG
jgi:hypothetical protein